MIRVLVLALLTLSSPVLAQEAPPLAPPLEVIGDDAEWLFVAVEGTRVRDGDLVRLLVIGLMPHAPQPAPRIHKMTEFNCLAHIQRTVKMAVHSPQDELVSVLDEDGEWTVVPKRSQDGMIISYACDGARGSDVTGETLDEVLEVWRRSRD